jgi:hypothetical protein
MKKIIILFMMLASSMSVSATSLPMFVVTTFEDEQEAQFVELLQKQEALANVSHKSYGAPIRLMVSYHHEATAGGSVASFTTLMMSASSLGVIPVLENNDFVVSYQLRVQSKTIASFSYVINTTDAISIYAGRQTKFSPKVQAFVDSTPAKFAADLAKDAAFKALTQEYEFYFGKQ